MPRKYKRKAGVQPRIISWNEDNLAAAMEEMEQKEMGINEISRTYGIPSRTLRRRYAEGNKKQITLGKHPTLGFENEDRLAAHIQELEKSGFPPERKTVRSLAYQFAEKLQIKHNFNHKTEMAGFAWLQSFLERHPELSIRQAEGLSVARAMGLNREDVDNFYELLIDVLTENDLLDKPERIFNMDETGVQMNNNPGKVIATKGSRVVHSVTSAEKGETMTVIACCNAVGNFLPPVVIIKGVNKKPEFLEGLPPGSKIFMNKKSAYINAELFHQWLTDHFMPRKPEGKILLILDGHSSHSSAIDMLETTKKNKIILLCLPSHTTSALQPLDLGVFKPFKTFFTAETNHYMRTNPQKKITRYQSGQLIGKAWIRATTPANALAGFRGSGIYPINKHAIPDREFAMSDRNDSQNLLSEQLFATTETADTSNHHSQASSNRASPGILSPYPSSVITNTTQDIETEDPAKKREQENPSNILQESPTVSKYFNSEIHNSAPEKETLSKLLHEALPIPKLQTPLAKRGKQSASILNSKSSIQAKKEKATKGIPIKKSKKPDVKRSGKENSSKTKVAKKRELSTQKEKAIAKKRVMSTSSEE